MRYVYAVTSALLLGGTAYALTSNEPLGAQVAQNDQSVMSQVAPPRAGAPMSFANMVQKMQPAVVNISTRARVKVPNNNPFAGTPFAQFFGLPEGGPQTREEQSLGSGFIISPDGYIVTNNHVVTAGNQNAAVDSITVIMPDRTEYEAKLVGRDAASDLAVLKISPNKTLPFVKFGDSSQTRVGDWVVAIGDPFGLGSTVTAGIVSAIHRSADPRGGAYDRYIQTDASINPGNSGGPMFDLNGNVIGINSSIYTPSGGNVGIGFAIPAEIAQPIVQTLMKGGTIERGYIGVRIGPMSSDLVESLGLPSNEGEFIQGVEPGQPADKAGIKAGDVVTKINGQTVTPDNSLSYIVANLPVGKSVPIEVLRNGKRLNLSVTLVKRPSEEELSQFSQGGDDDDFSNSDEQSNKDAANKSVGVAVLPLTPTIARQIGVPADTRGVVIAGVDPSSDAASKGLRRGDVILSANRRPVTSEADLGQAVKQVQADGRNAILLQVRRGSDQPIFIPIRLNEPSK